MSPIHFVVVRRRGGGRGAAATSHLSSRVALEAAAQRIDLGARRREPRADRRRLAFGTAEGLEARRRLRLQSLHLRREGGAHAARRAGTTADNST